MLSPGNPKSKASGTSQHGWLLPEAEVELEVVGVGNGWHILQVHVVIAVAIEQEVDAGRSKRVEQSLAHHLIGLRGHRAQPAQYLFAEGTDDLGAALELVADQGQRTRRTLLRPAHPRDSPGACRDR